MIIWWSFPNIDFIVPSPGIFICFKPKLLLFYIDAKKGVSCVSIKISGTLLKVGNTRVINKKHRKTKRVKIFACIYSAYSFSKSIIIKQI